MRERTYISGEAWQDFFIIIIFSKGGEEFRSKLGNDIRCLLPAHNKVHPFKIILKSNPLYAVYTSYNEDKTDTINSRTVLVLHTRPVKKKEIVQLRWMLPSYVFSPQMLPPSFQLKLSERRKRLNENKNK